MIERILRLHFFVLVIIGIGKVTAWATRSASTTLHLGHHLLELSHVHAAGATAHSFHAGHAAHASHAGHTAAHATSTAHHSCEAFHTGHAAHTGHTALAAHAAHTGHAAGGTTLFTAESLHGLGIISLHALVTLFLLVIGVDP